MSTDLRQEQPKDLHCLQDMRPFFRFGVQHKTFRRGVLHEYASGDATFDIHGY